MNSEIKKIWTDKLLSGCYIQGKDALRIDNRFCCLGVLCDIYSELHSIDWTPGVNYYSFLEEVEFLPNPVAKWAELDCYDPTIRSVDLTLSVLNDRCYTFKQIANFIKNEL